ncbi:hypothetical protein PENSPDRAFT_213844 [Peniophora sp. CONT]|nr:hypothetical protein PENSPDRAFT_213844 [Peniophora sp. CONT]
MSTQIQTAHSPAFEFLAYPPPSRYPTTSAPRQRSVTVSTTISTWAARVTPGSPAAPSPPVSASSNGKPGLSPRFPSTHSRSPIAASIRAVSASYVNVHTPSLKEFQHTDLAALGYAFAVVPLPTPTTPHSAAVMGTAPTKPTLAIPPPPPSPSPSTFSTKSKSNKKKRGLAGLFRSGTRAKSPAPVRRRGSLAGSPTTRAHKIADAKRRQYAAVAPALDADLRLVQLMDGGAFDDVVSSHQTRAAHSMSKPQNGGRGEEIVGTVHRNDDGAVYRDAYEPVEYEHLLEGMHARTPSDVNWVAFETPRSSISHSSGAVSAVPVESVFRPTRARENSTDSIPMLDPAPAPRRRTSEDSNASSASKKLPLLAIPARAQRKAAHLLAPGYADASTFFMPSTPRTPKSPKSPKSPKMPRARGRDRRRPAPLNIPLPAPMDVSPVESPSPRTMFLSDSFAPSPSAAGPVRRTRSRSRSYSRARAARPVPPPSQAIPPVPPMPREVLDFGVVAMDEDMPVPAAGSHRGLAKKPSRMNLAMRSMFGKRKD